MASNSEDTLQALDGIYDTTSAFSNNQSFRLLRTVEDQVTIDSGLT
jgi:hypothetical protein